MGCVRITCLLLLCSFTTQAQTFAEWFKQKSTQKKYLTQQIAALQVYSGYLHQGYAVAKNGLGGISKAISLEYSLHGNHYRQLKTVSNLVRQDPKVRDISRWLNDILGLVYDIRHQQGLSVKERSYVSKVCLSLLADCDAQINDLETILKGQHTSMNDEERLRQLSRLHASMEDNHIFARKLQKDLRLYSLSKRKISTDTKHLKTLYEKD
jgi:hypothetical protein